MKQQTIVHFACGTALYLVDFHWNEHCCEDTTMSVSSSMVKINSTTLWLLDFWPGASGENAGLWYMTCALFYFQDWQKFYASTVSKFPVWCDQSVELDAATTKNIPSTIQCLMWWCDDEPSDSWFRHYMSLTASDWIDCLMKRRQNLDGISELYSLRNGNDKLETGGIRQNRYTGYRSIHWNLIQSMQQLNQSHLYSVLQL